MHKATNIDTDKALEAIKSLHRINCIERQKELYGIQKQYDGLVKGLGFAESLFECSDYEKDEPETVHTKIQYNNREYTVSELCERMEELEQLVKDTERR